MYYAHEFLELAIRRLAKGKWVRLIALKSTADFYGWSTVFPLIADAKSIDYPSGIRPMPMRPKLTNYRACPLYICRSEVSKHGYPKRLTNRFRVTNNAATVDLVAIAQATQIPFGWMTDKAQQRISSDRWLAHSMPERYCHLDKRVAN